ncbi:MAG: cytidylate kinase-like family protein [Clostridia bacterium]|nr:cytidylate kinase-like family protein [Clostridia bacterium]MDE7257325.1 cytidylate kinase-like family protein [Clostridia bacterium]
MIVTISRQFGSGGREIGKRLADELGLKYYDKELITEIAGAVSLNEEYVEKVLENGGFKNFAFSFAHSMPLAVATPNTVTDVLVAQQKVIRAVAKKGNCVIVGRCADVIAREFNPVRIFVYADEKSKLERCRARAKDGENLTDKQMLKNFKDIDKGRAKLYDLLSATAWGAREGYDIMLNTSRVEITKIIKPLSDLITVMSAKD